MRFKTQIIAVVIVIILVGIIGIFGVGPNPITGFVSSNTYVQSVNYVIEKNSGYFFEPEDFNNDNELKSLRVSGKVYGTGVVKMYIEDSTGERFIVYSNQKVKSFNRITGMAIKSIPSDSIYSDEESSESDSPTLPFTLKEIKGDTGSYFLYEKPASEKEGNIQEGVTGLVPGSATKEDLNFDLFETIPDDENRPLTFEFLSECVETCTFFSKDKSFRFIFEIEEGTYFQLTEIIYTINEETSPLL